MDSTSSLPVKNHAKYPDALEFPAVEFNYMATTKSSSDSSSRYVSSNTKLSGKSQRVIGIESVDDDRSKKKWINKREKVEKIIAKKYQKNIQPGECMRFLRVDFDEGIGKFDFCQELQLLLDNANVKTQKIPLIFPNSLNWTRFIEINTINSNNEIDTFVQDESQQDVMIIWNWDEIVEKIYNQSFGATLINISTVLLNKKLSLIMYGMEGYFLYHRANNNNDNNRKKNVEAMYHNISELPKISRKEFECLLVEAQITLRCNITLIENAQEMSLMIFQHTKAMAEMPYKKEMRETEVEKVDFYAIGDNKNTIKVDGSGFGLRRLWLRHLCLFNNAGLATAEAICAVYPSPSQLMKAYMNCSTEVGEILLKDIPIRRGRGELCKLRKIGLELSRKIYIMFTSMSGRILNRFSKDIDCVDELFPMFLTDAIQIFAVMIGILAQVFIINWWTIFPMIVMGYFYWKIRPLSLATAQDIKRWEGISEKLH